MGKRNKPITIWRRTEGGARVGTSALVSRRTQRFKTRSKFTVAFEPKEDWDVFLDSRHLNRRIGDRLRKHYLRSIRDDRNPETGQANPVTYRTESGRWRERSKSIGRVMAGALRRTITTSEASWGGGAKRISLARTRMKFYFADPKAAAVNKFDSTRKHNRAYYLGTGGKVRPLFDQEIGKWMDLVLDGHEFPRDTKTDAWG